MDTRRDFLKKASLLAGATAYSTSLPASIRRALEIEAPLGSTYLEAEHVVFLMQENRSFDHCYGALRGVRGFRDPRAMLQPSDLPVWFQSDQQEKTYGPFRLDIQNTKATWMGSLPHSWSDMVAARNHGKMNQWLEAKRPGNPEYRDLPLTMGFYNREDIPFYYAFADAFTVCDQHFCSSLTGTSANRSYFWAGAIREEPHNPESVAHVDNGQINFKDVGWTTYPERLQKAGVSWKVYQNELSIPVGFEGQEEDWLANFTDNNLEFYKQYQVRFHPAHRAHLQSSLNSLEAEIKSGTGSAGLIAEKVKLAEKIKRDLEQFSPENFDKLSAFEKEIHRRAFVTNTGDPDYHKLEEIPYTAGGVAQNLKVPKGDVLHQFRQDVNSDQLPLVSWLVAPSNFSDHPGAPWYGAWYVSEVLDILTKNPEIWKKTIFVLTYDENDGYFDHVSPFIPPHTQRPDSGAAPEGMHTEEEFVTAEQEKRRTANDQATLDSPIGLGYRVPLVVASPWSKGGWVNSQVFDHSSCLQFLEHFVAVKTRKNIAEENISSWRQLVCGDLTSVFRPATKEAIPPVESLDRDGYVKRIFSAKSKQLPGNHQLLDAQALEVDSAVKALAQLQEKGVKPACALPYNVMANAVLVGSELEMRFEVRSNKLKRKKIGVPLQVFARNYYQSDAEKGRQWAFAVSEEQQLNYRWKLSDFKSRIYHFHVQGPNGFFRSFRGSARDPLVEMALFPNNQRSALGLEFEIKNNSASRYSIVIEDQSYGYPAVQLEVKPGMGHQFFDLMSSKGWYDFKVRLVGSDDYEQHFTGHIENEKHSTTDPLMGGILD